MKIDMHSHRRGRPRIHDVPKLPLVYCKKCGSTEFYNWFDPERNRIRLQCMKCRKYREVKLIQDQTKEENHGFKGISLSKEDRELLDKLRRRQTFHSKQTNKKE